MSSATTRRTCLGRNFSRLMKPRWPSFLMNGKTRVRGMVATHWVSAGTRELLEGNVQYARFYASSVFFIQEVLPISNGARTSVNGAQVHDLFTADDHTLVSFLRKRIPCSCLDEKHKEVKNMPKMSYCYNEQCSLGRRVERSKVKPCSRCCQAFYCSRECHVADWPRHKTVCNVNARSRQVLYRSTQLQLQQESVVKTDNFTSLDSF